MRILSVLAHPDDAEIWTGGTLASHVRKGDEVVVCTFADPGSVRAKEAEVGSQLLGTKIELLNSKLLQPNSQLTAELKGLLQNLLPHIVITHWEHDTHFEHRMVFDAIMQIVVSTRIEHRCPTALISCDTYNSLGMQGVFNPSMFIDVSAVWENKLAAIRAHKSQPIHLWEEMITRLGKLQGYRSGCEYAEAFIQVPILGQLSSWKYLPQPIQ